MKNKARLFGIHLPVFIVVLLAAVTLQTVGLIAFFRDGYFTNDVIGNASWLTVCVGSLFFLLYIWTARKDVTLIPSFGSPANYIPSALLGTATLILSLRFLNVMKSISSHISFLKDFDYEIPATQYIRLFLSCAIVLFGILSVIYFVLNAIFIRTVSIRRASFGLFVLLFLASYTAYIYFDNSFSMNSPIKLTNEMAYLFSAVFFLFEIRLSLGREKWRHYIAFGFIASLLTAYSSIPSLIIYFVSGKLCSLSIYETALTLTLFIFITSKLLLTGNLIEKKESPIIARLRTTAKEREDELNPPSLPESEAEAEIDEAEEFIPDENQISIEDLDEENPENAEAVTDEIIRENTDAALDNTDIKETVTAFTEEKESKDEENPCN